MNLCIFSGGRGNQPLFNVIKSDANKELIKHASIIVNGLDDGASTGAIRNIFDRNTHGISDFLKVILSLSSNVPLIEFLERRLPTPVNFLEYIDIATQIKALATNNDKFDALYEGIDKQLRGELSGCFETFFNYYYRKHECLPRFSDYKIGNIIFAGCMIKERYSFSSAVSRVANLLDVDRARFDILESSGTPTYLVGLTSDGVLLPNEASIVSVRTTDIIDSVFQLTDPLTAEEIRVLCSGDAQYKKNILHNRSTFPEANIKVTQAIERADLLIYGSGTPFSSIIPSLQLPQIRDAILVKKAPKILIANLKKESANSLSVSDLIDMYYRSLGGVSSEFNSINNMLTHIIVDDETIKPPIKQKIEIDVERIRVRYPSLKINLSNVRSKYDPWKHDGEKLLNAIRHIYYAT